ncbi:hypothetical protein LTR66_012059 [Elasticomyces elasticus]|nr:hypothetical protein LTR66_012059 [Elasticomyces elasticus]
MKTISAQDLHFHIDKYINPYLPPSQLYRLPRFISRFFGYREVPKQDVGSVLVWLWSFVGAFCAIALVCGLFNATPWIQAFNPPVVIASIGAGAILDYNTISSPLAQPRNAIFGHTLSAITGVAITKLFLYSPHFLRIRWLAAALCCASASVVMGVTNTVHPPGGAAAILAATEPAITAMGWWYPLIVLIGSLLMLLTAMVVNNIQRRYPLYWWTPEVVGRAKKADAEKGGSVGSEDSLQKSVMAEQVEGAWAVVITANHISLPGFLTLGEEQMDVLQQLQSELWAQANGHASHTTP